MNVTSESYNMYAQLTVHSLVVVQNNKRCAGIVIMFIWTFSFSQWPPQSPLKILTFPHEHPVC